MTMTIHDFLPCPTPEAWLAVAPDDLETLLVDHAHCERKAAATAMRLMHDYAGLTDLQEKMSRLAREELRHFEQVLKIIRQRGMRYRRMAPSRYASGLREQVRKEEPGKLVDLLVCGAFIEARSCERFEALIPRLDEQVGGFYARLLKSEARHFRDYLKLAEAANEGPVDDRVALFAEREAELITSPDTQFRFHSGVPA
ncbi:tRNA-(ms[2]io[6]A)-hydroxylase [Natronospira bacteriovora]|uniref:tRNA isopentenyl-2-thiomethyl-A-37 hydroxylase MiaE n=1 Tax=Natronospira bacteriovora TaxID=3069753 RepID=A0ABU0W4U5_9GAMM|nr:tRNA isopentenyl-2-thiomethyl-A-37 hydroxylase MiaE [Natronospira sp. AB-CW4]MDQ2068933.1 tRNA isopentenyl-2-thiomethyl-A-37 hydroxylase MiaE [Natronospira sp. AB-CW4]